MKRLLLSFLALMLCAQLAQAQSAVIQKVLIEEFTGAWCGWCPDGAVVLENILNAEPNAIGISIHNGDAMQNQDGSQIDGYFSGGSYPSGTVNRKNIGVSRSNWMSQTQTALMNTPEVAVSFGAVTYDWTARSVTAEVHYEVLTPLTGKARINIYMVEDGVTGSGAGYDQVNYLNGQTGHPYAGAGNPIVGFVHDHVFRVGFVSAWGGQGVIPDDAQPGVYSYTLTKALHSSWDEQNIQLVAWAARFNGSGTGQREILNAEEMPLSVALNAETPVHEDAAFMQISPNPASDRATITFTLKETTTLRMEVLNTMGQHIATLGDGIMNQGTHSLYWNGRNDAGTPVANGIYLVRLVTESGQSITRRMQIAR